MITYFIVCIIAVTMVIRAIRANRIRIVFTGTRAIRNERVVFGNISVIKDTRDLWERGGCIRDSGMLRLLGLYGISRAYWGYWISGR